MGAPVGSSQNCRRQKVNRTVGQTEQLSATAAASLGSRGRHVTVSEDRGNGCHRRRLLEVRCPMVAR